MLDLSTLDRNALEALAMSLLQDSLTKIYNLHAVSMEADSFKNGYLILFDVDDFKRFNTLYGHLGGDTVLQSIAASIREETDFAFRCGGDEFGAFVNCDSLEQAETIGNRVLGRCFEIAVCPSVVSCSIGVVPMRGRSYYEARNECDKLVYAAKERGKACVVASNI